MHSEHPFTTLYILHNGLVQPHYRLYHPTSGHI
nr:MAG TPA: hypothetical protein [Caudoviricetes sp.]